MFVFCPGCCLGLEVRQSTSDLIKQPGDKVQIFCSHDKTDYRTMLWYQRSPGDTAMKLIGYLYFKDVKMEEKYENGSLIVKRVGPNHSAVYYCAASKAH
uniref:Ig-like domain-containing protein n=1 Tax=Dicentrarchus labrax TaxID=13489 RepID=A0A8C4NR71_DICLA